MAKLFSKQVLDAFLWTNSPCIAEKCKILARLFGLDERWIGEFVVSGLENILPRTLGSEHPEPIRKIQEAARAERLNVTDPVVAIHAEEILEKIDRKSTIQIWLYEQKDVRIEGTIIGFDEFMNLVLDQAVEISKEASQNLGRILVKGETISLIMEKTLSE